MRTPTFLPARLMCASRRDGGRAGRALEPVGAALGDHHDPGVAVARTGRRHDARVGDAQARDARGRGAPGRPPRGRRCPSCTSRPGGGTSRPSAETNASQLVVGLRVVGRHAAPRRPTARTPWWRRSRARASDAVTICRRSLASPEVVRVDERLGHRVGARRAGPSRATAAARRPGRMLIEFGCALADDDVERARGRTRSGGPVPARLGSDLQEERGLRQVLLARSGPAAVPSWMTPVRTWLWKFLPTPGRSTTVSIPTACRFCAGRRCPTASGACGDSIAPPQTMTSARRARLVPLAVLDVLDADAAAVLDDELRVACACGLERSGSGA